MSRGAPHEWSLDRSSGVTITDAGSALEPPAPLLHEDRCERLRILADGRGGDTRHWKRGADDDDQAHPVRDGPVLHLGAGLGRGPAARAAVQCGDSAPARGRATARLPRRGLLPARAIRGAPSKRAPRRGEGVRSFARRRPGLGPQGSNPPRRGDRRPRGSSRSRLRRLPISWSSELTAAPGSSGPCSGASPTGWFARRRARS